MNDALKVGLVVALVVAVSKTLNRAFGDGLSDSERAAYNSRFDVRPLWVGNVPGLGLQDAHSYYLGGNTDPRALAYLMARVDYVKDALERVARANKFDVDEAALAAVLSGLESLWELNVLNTYRLSHGRPSIGEIMEYSFTPRQWADVLPHLMALPDFQTYT